MNQNLHKTETVNTRMTPDLKTEAETIFHKLGLTSAEAIRLFYKHVCLNRGLPFELKIPNKTTQDAIDRLEAGEGVHASSVKELFESLNK